jgi:RPA family protein
VTRTDHIRTSVKAQDLLSAYVPIFSCELDQTDYLIAQQEQPTHILTPTGGNIQKIWLVGALTSFEPGRQGGIIRVADPTGAVSFILRPQALDSLDPADLVPPLFLSITAHPENSTGSDRTIRWIVETCRIATRRDRDIWIQAAAASLLDRLYELRKGLLSGDMKEEMREAQTHYHIQSGHLKEFAERAEKALGVIKEPGPPVDPAELILSIIKEYSGPRGIHIDDIHKYTRRAALADDLVRNTIRNLVAEDEVYQPAPGYIKLL